MGLTRDGVDLHISSFPDDGVSGGGSVPGRRIRRCVACGACRKGGCSRTRTDGSKLGNRETYVEDADGNSIRFVHGGGG